MRNILSFNESDKYFNTKSMMDTIDGILVDLRDYGVNILVEPSNDIRVKLLSMGNTQYLYIDFNLHLLSKDEISEIKNILLDKILTISDYLSRKGFSAAVEIWLHQLMPSERINVKSLTLDKISSPNRIRLNFNNIVNESLPNQRNIDQLKKVMKISAKTDIGNRISDMNKQGANIDYIHNPIDTGIESKEDYERHNKKFISSWNLKHLVGPFSPEPKPAVNFHLDYKQKQDKIKK